MIHEDLRSKLINSKRIVRQFRLSGWAFWRETYRTPNREDGQR